MELEHEIASMYANDVLYTHYSVVVITYEAIPTAGLTNKVSTKKKKEQTITLL